MIRIVSVVLIAISSLFQVQLVLGDGVNALERTIELFRAGIPSEIVSHLRLPIKRRYPLPDIRTRQYAFDHFDEIFDETLIKEIAESSSTGDWQEVGWRGLMLGRGDVWADDKGNIIAINYETDKEKEEWNKLVDSQKAALPERLRDFDYPISMWSTKEHVVRVDDVDGKPRLVVWRIEDRQNPELVLYNGKVTGYGTIETFNLDWSDKGLVYRVEENSEVVGELPSYQILREIDIKKEVFSTPIRSEPRVGD